MTADSDLEALVRALIPAYLAARRDDCQRLETAIADRDHATIRDLGHRLAGSGASYGFPAISAVGSRLEAAAKLRDLASATRALRALATVLERAESSG